jgi:16S rRNA (cytidine1402-2'-O)-methyltransferase
MPLVFVPTPLGNLGDITLRALDVLRRCDLIVAEDTRVAQRLLNALDLPRKPLLSYREQNAAAATPAILARALGGLVAVVTDAGMPGVSDPGRELIVAARDAAIAVEVLPGPVAFVCAAVLSGFELAGLTFAGFVPRAAGARRTALAAALRASGPTAWYESPHRIVATLEALAEIAPDARAFVARELTKLHEQQILGTPADVLRALERPVRGEVVLVVAPMATARESAPQDDVDARIDALIDAGMPAAAVAKAVAAETGAARAAAYERVVARKRGRGDARP